MSYFITFCHLFLEILVFFNMNAKSIFLITALMAIHILSINGGTVHSESITETAMGIDINEPLEDISNEESLGILPFKKHYLLNFVI